MHAFYVNALCIYRHQHTYTHMRICRIVMMIFSNWNISTMVEFIVFYIEHGIVCTRALTPTRASSYTHTHTHTYNTIFGLGHLSRKIWIENSVYIPFNTCTLTVFGFACVGLERWERERERDKKKENDSIRIGWENDDSLKVVVLLLCPKQLTCKCICQNPRFLPSV